MTDVYMYLHRPMPEHYSVKLNSLDLQCFHRDSLYNEVWERESYVTLFSPSSHSKW